MEKKEWEKESSKTLTKWPLTSFESCGIHTLEGHEQPSPPFGLRPWPADFQLVSYACLSEWQLYRLTALSEQQKLGLGKNRESTVRGSSVCSPLSPPTAFQTEGKLYLILDFLRGGDLFTRLSKEVGALPAHP